MSATLRRPQGRGFTYLCLDEGETYLGDFIGAVTRLGGGEGGEQSERMRKGRVRLGTHNLFFEREAGGGGAGGASLVAAARAMGAARERAAAAAARFVGCFASLGEGEPQA